MLNEALRLWMCLGFDNRQSYSVRVYHHSLFLLVLFLKVASSRQYFILSHLEFLKVSLLSVTMCSLWGPLSSTIKWNCETLLILPAFNMILSSVHFIGKCDRTHPALFSWWYRFHQPPLGQDDLMGHIWRWQFQKWCISVKVRYCEDKEFISNKRHCMIQYTSVLLH